MVDSHVCWRGKAAWRELREMDWVDGPKTPPICLSVRPETQLSALLEPRWDGRAAAQLDSGVERLPDEMSVEVWVANFQEQEQKFVPFRIFAPIESKELA